MNSHESAAMREQPPYSRPLVRFIGYASIIGATVSIFVLVGGPDTDERGTNTVERAMPCAPLARTCRTHTRPDPRDAATRRPASAGSGTVPEQRDVQGSIADVPRRLAVLDPAAMAGQQAPGIVRRIQR